MRATCSKIEDPVRKESTTVTDICSYDYYLAIRQTIVYKVHVQQRNPPLNGRPARVSCPSGISPGTAELSTTNEQIARPKQITNNHIKHPILQCSARLTICALGSRILAAKLPSQNWVSPPSNVQQMRRESVEGKQMFVLAAAARPAFHASAGATCACDAQLRTVSY